MRLRQLLLRFYKANRVTNGYSNLCAEIGWNDKIKANCFSACNYNVFIQSNFKVLALYVHVFFLALREGMTIIKKRDNPATDRGQCRLTGNLQTRYNLTLSTDRLFCFLVCRKSHLPQRGGPLRGFRTPRLLARSSAYKNKSDKKKGLWTNYLYLKATRFAAEENCNKD